MAISRGPKIVTNGLVLALDASDDNSFAAQNLPIKNGLLLWLDAADDDSFVYSSGTEVSQWRDKSGNNFHANQATVANQPSRNTVVNSRKSVNFTSTNGDRLRVDSGMIFTNSVTAIVFIKPGSQNYAYANILDQDHGMDGANGWVIQRNNVSSAWQSWVGNAAGDNWFNPNQISYTDNTPQIVTLRKGSSTVTLYSNGTSSGDVTISDQSIRQVGYLGLNIGSWRAGGFSDRHYNGEICEIVVYNRALSLTEVKQVHTYLGQKWGILNTDRSIVDASGSAYVGLLGNGTTSAMPVYDFYNKGALKFDGTDDYVVGSVPSIAASSTVGMWIKSANYGGKIPFSIAGATYGSGPNIFFSGNFINWNTGDGAGNPFSGSSYPDSNWHYIVVTNDPATNAKLYIDGVLIGTAAYRNTLSTNSNNLWLGRFSGDNNYTINGNIAGTQIYNRVLSATEVLQNYNAQKSRFINTIVQQGLVLNLDAGNPYSYAGAGTAWYDVSGNTKDFIIDGSGITYNSGGYFTLADGGITRTATITNSTTCTVVIWLRTTDTQALTFKGNNSGSFYLAAYYVGSGFYSDNCGSPTYWIDTLSVSNPNPTYLDGNWHMWEMKNVNFSSWTNYEFNKYGGFTFGNGAVGQIMIYDRNLSSAESLQIYNATKGRFGL
jgi:hypothetical protein